MNIRDLDKYQIGGSILNLQFLFAEPILHVEELTPGYDDHASDVWLVHTEHGESVVRTSRMVGEPSNPFWWGCKRLFGIDPRRVHALEKVNNVLADLGSISVPRVIGKGIQEDREFVVVEKLQGQVLHSLFAKPHSLLESLGEGFARIHQHTRDYAGHPTGTFRVEQQEFHQHLAEGMMELVRKFYSDQSAVADKLPQMLELLRSAPVPQRSSYVLVDLDPSQFVTDGQTITGLVDTEAYVIAPREFDLIGLEYILDEQGAHDFARGYEKVMPLPHLEPYRLPYRYLYRLLAVQGRVEMETWLRHPHFFD